VPSPTTAGCLVPRLSGSFKATLARRAIAERRRIKLTLPSDSPSGSCRKGNFFVMNVPRTGRAKRSADGVILEPWRNAGL
jgi:hypothetical protein